MSHTSFLYFAYGGNMWKQQMKRFPDHEYVGVGRLDDWCFIINESGYANIIHSPGDHVYGLVFALSAKDVKLMDEHEGDDYTRKTMWLQVTTSSDYEEETTGDEKALVYKDVDRTEHGVPGEDQTYRMNMAVMDALDAGVPQSYIDKYIRVFIPE